MSSLLHFDVEVPEVLTMYSVEKNYQQVVEVHYFLAVWCRSYGISPLQMYFQETEKNYSHDKAALPDWCAMAIARIRELRYSSAGLTVWHVLHATIVGDFEHSSFQPVGVADALTPFHLQKMGPYWPFVVVAGTYLPVSSQHCCYCTIAGLGLAYC